MKFDDAVKEMEKLAEGRSWSFMYEVASYKRGPAIHGYIDHGNAGHAHESSTYAGAIENVKAMLGLSPSDPAPEDGTDTSRPNPLE